MVSVKNIRHPGDLDPYPATETLTQLHPQSRRAANPVVIGVSPQAAVSNDRTSAESALRLCLCVRVGIAGRTHRRNRVECADPYSRAGPRGSTTGCGVYVASEHETPWLPNSRIRSVLSSLTRRSARTIGCH